MTIYDDCTRLNLALLAKNGYLLPNQAQSGVVRWGESSIYISTIMQIETGALLLNYTSNGTPINYAVRLISRPSNLGIGRVWYFVCPKTAKLCRKLFLINGIFAHRTAAHGMYEAQTRGKSNRATLQYLDNYYTNTEKIESLKRVYYAGKETRKFSALLRKLARNKALGEKMQSEWKPI